MSTYVDAPTYSFVAGAALVENRRVTLNSSGQVVYATNNNIYIGVTEHEAASGALVSVRLRFSRIELVTVGAAVAVGGAAYGAANGKMTETAAGNQSGIFMDVGTADGAQVRMLPTAA